jgi:hypothetical protein
MNARTEGRRPRREGSNMVAFAFAERYPERTTKLVIKRQSRPSWIFCPPTIRLTHALSVSSRLAPWREAVPVSGHQESAEFRRLYCPAILPKPALMPSSLRYRRILTSQRTLTAIIVLPWLSQANGTLDMAARPTTLRRACLRRARSIQNPLTRHTSLSQVISPRQFSSPARIVKGAYFGSPVRMRRKTAASSRPTVA